MPTAAIYLRVSEPKQLKGNGLHDQLEECRRYASEHGFTVAREHEFAEKGVTGGVLSRPVFNALKAQAGKVNAVIFRFQDRISRADELETINLMRWFEDSGTEVHTTNRGRIDTRDFGSVIMAFADAYQNRTWRENNKKRVTASRRTNARNGKISPTRVPRYGYNYIPKSQGGPRLDLNEDECKVVQDIYTWFADGDGTGKKLPMQAIANRLTAQGVPTAYDRTKHEREREQPAVNPRTPNMDGRKYSGMKKKAYGTWTQATIQGILSNSLYKGEAVYGKTKAVHYEDENGFDVQKNDPRPEDEWIRIKVPACVSVELWDRAQRQRRTNTQRSPRRTQHEYLMRALLQCERCGHRFHSGLQGKWGYYRCGGSRNDFARDGKTLTCHGKYRADWIDALVWQEVKAFVLDPKQLLEGKRVSDSERSAKTVALEKRRREVIREAAEKQAARDILVDVRLSGRITKEKFEEKDDALKGRLAELELENETLAGQLEEAAASNEVIRGVFEFCQRMRENIDELTFEDKRTVLDALNITGVVQRGETPDQDMLILTGRVHIEISLAQKPKRGRGRFETTTVCHCSSKTDFPLTFVIPLRGGIHRRRSA